MNKMSNVNKLTMSDVRSLKHNLDGEEVGDFMDNYGWEEDDEIDLWDGQDAGTWNGKKVTVKESDVGYLVGLDDKMEYLVSIYEPHGFDLNEKRGLLIIYGHEDIVQLWLDDGEMVKTGTR